MIRILLAVIALLAFPERVSAGRPLIFTEGEVCFQTDLVVIATLQEPIDVPTDTDDPFGGFGSKWHHFGFTHFAKTKVEGVLLGDAPKELLVYGGKLNAGIPYRLEKGRFLLLLKKVQDDEDGYRAVDWHYSFVPMKGDKVGWLVNRYPEKREWITPTEAIDRIKALKNK